MNIEHPTSNGVCKLIVFSICGLSALSKEPTFRCSALDVRCWMFIFFIMKSRKDETTKNNSEYFVLIGFRVLVIMFIPRVPTTEYNLISPYSLLPTDFRPLTSVFRPLAFWPQGPCYPSSEELSSGRLLIFLLRIRRCSPILAALGYLSLRDFSRERLRMAWVGLLMFGL